jgi:hypothetical protein
MNTTFRKLASHHLKEKNELIEKGYLKLGMI